MKKLIAGLFAAAMLAAGLVTVSGGTSPANAACTPTKYNPNACPTVVIKKPKGVGTTPATAPKLKAGKLKKLKITFSGKAGTKATIKITVGSRVGHTAKPGAKGPASKPASAKAGKPVTVKVPKLTKKGTYKIYVTVTPKGGVPKTTVYYIKIV